MLRNSLCEQSQFTHNFLFNSTIKSFNDIFPNIEFLLREKEIAPQTLQIHTLEKKIVAPPNFCTFRRACRICSVQLIDLDVSNFEYRIFVVVFLQASAVEEIKTNIQNSKLDQIDELLSTLGEKKNV